MAIQLYDRTKVTDEEYADAVKHAAYGERK